MADITVSYNQNIIEGTYEALRASNLGSLLRGGMRVSIKPNMVLAKPPSSGATTHKEVVEGIIQYLNERGVNKIEIIESAWIGDNTKKVYQVCGYEELRRKYGIDLIDLKDDKTTTLKVAEYSNAPIEVCNKALNADFLINVPVLKAHCQTKLTCNLKNLKGCIPDREKRRFHTLGLHRPIAYLNKALKTHFCVVDGVCGDLTFEEGGNPVTRNMIIAGEDPLLIDSYCAGLIGYEINDIDYLAYAYDLGIGRLFDETADLLELNADNKPKFIKADSTLVKSLAAYIEEDGACSACYSSLVFALHQLGGSQLRKLDTKIRIGQGFRGKEGALGCGNCTSGCGQFMKGCPPKASEIYRFLMEKII